MIKKTCTPGESIISGMLIFADPDALYNETHSHSQTEIIMVKTGSMELHLENTILELTEGMIIIINGNVPHSAIFSEDESNYLIYITSPYSESDEENIFHSVPYAVFSKGDEHYEELSELIKTTCEHCEKHPTRSALKGDFYYFLGFMRKTGMLDKNELRSSEKIKDIIEFLNKEYAEQLSIEDIANKFFMNPTYLCRIFKQATNYTIMQYINHIRTKNAEKLLAGTDMSVLDISNAVGFSSQPYFNKIFKKFTSMTPAAYRRYHKSRR